MHDASHFKIKQATDLPETQIKKKQGTTKKSNFNNHRSNYKTKI
jgi:hypothetical protein